MCWLYTVGQRLGVYEFKCTVFNFGFIDCKLAVHKKLSNCKTLVMYRNRLVGYQDPQLDAVSCCDRLPAATDCLAALPPQLPALPQAELAPSLDYWQYLSPIQQFVELFTHRTLDPGSRPWQQSSLLIVLIESQGKVVQFLGRLALL